MSTMMFCDMHPPEHILTQAFDSSKTWSINNNILSFRDAGNNVVAEMKKVG
jgi:hypothetical protein